MRSCSHSLPHAKPDVALLALVFCVAHGHCLHDHEAMSIINTCYLAGLQGLPSKCNSITVNVVCNITSCTHLGSTEGKLGSASSTCAASRRSARAAPTSTPLRVACTGNDLCAFPPCMSDVCFGQAHCSSVKSRCAREGYRHHLFVSVFEALFKQALLLI